LRIKGDDDKRKAKIKVVGVSGPLLGTLLCSPRPDPPSVDPFPPVTNVPLLTLSGGKPA
jgi:hypothetical protein